MKQTIKTIIIVLCVAVVVWGGWRLVNKNNIQVSNVPEITNPNTTTSSSFAEKPGLIRVTSPAINALVKSPLRVMGEALGSWFVDGNFTLRLLGEGGNTLAWVPVSAIVPKGKKLNAQDYFKFDIGFEFNAKSKIGTLVLQKPGSGGWSFPDYVDELRMSVRFE